MEVYGEQPMNLCLKDCPVCEKGFTIKHFHYGAKVCPACRSFFQRSAKNQTYKKFVCINRNNLCNLQSGSNKRPCRLCRFNKCVSIGMRIEWLVEVKRSTDNVGHLLNEYEISIRVTQTEEKEMLGKYNELVDFMNHSYLYYLTQNLDAMKKFAFAFFHSDSVPPDFLFNLCEMIGRRVSFNFITRECERNGISELDRDKLIENNSSMGSAFRWSALCNEEEFSYFYQVFHKKGKNLKGSNETIDFLLDCIDLLIKNGENPIKRLVQALLSSLHYVTRNHKEIVEGIMENTQPWFEKTQTKETDVIIKGLMYYISITHPGSSHFQDPQLIDRLHQNHVWALYRYLKTNYKNEASKRLHNILLTMHYTTKFKTILKEQNF